MAFNTTDNRIFLVETSSPFERVSFQFMPDGVQNPRKAKLQTIATVGRNNDLFHYTGGSDSLTFSIDFFSDEPDRKDVLTKVNFLKSLAMSDGGFGPAKTVKLVMGEMFRGQTWIVKDVDPKFANFSPDFNYLPLRATVKINLVLSSKTNRRVNDVRG